MHIRIVAKIIFGKIKETAKSRWKRSIMSEAFPANKAFTVILLQQILNNYVKYQISLGHLYAKK